MKLNSKGQVTIPAPLRAKHGLHEGDEIEVIEEGDALRIVRAVRARIGRLTPTTLRHLDRALCTYFDEPRLRFAVRM